MLSDMLASMDMRDSTSTTPDDLSGLGAGSERLRLVHEAIDAWRACGRLPRAGHPDSLGSADAQPFTEDCHAQHDADGERVAGQHVLDSV